MKVLKSIEVIKQIQIKGPQGGFVGNIINHQGSSGHVLTPSDDGRVIISHPSSPWSKVIPPTAIVAYEWFDVADEKPIAKAK